ncbi:sugar ABC transporter permease [Bifidobacterium subtile]|uniref:ABC transporter permease n=1 Tax=Bifidobacterium subtile TaxID=77635 RepID=A0A087E710_9BIFI|nr:sugar ABC transporter permease [Bifidobacterium subtile]KFJ03561.1 ABC transporter permease [Bifidobacterium subtile]
MSKDLATAANADENSTVHHDAAQNKSKNTYTRRRVGDALTYIFLSIMGIIWLVPIFWIFMESFNAFPGPYNDGFIPKEYTLRNYVQLWTDNSQLAFGQMYMRTLIVAIFTCLISTAFVLAVSYSLSRLRFSFRTKFMNIVLVLGMFPGIMVVASLYYLLKSMGLTNSGLPIIIGLIVVYSAGSGAGFFVMKGYMDTIPMSLDEAATLDGCTKWQVFTKIILPVARPMVVYQVITSFLAPWLDFVLAKAITRTQDNFTVALGLWQMIQGQGWLTQWYARFAAGAVCVSIPIAVLFMVMQHFYAESMSGSVKG